MKAIWQINETPSHCRDRIWHGSSIFNSKYDLRGISFYIDWKYDSSDMYNVTASQLYSVLIIKNKDYGL